MSLRTENISLNCKKAYFQTIIENLHVGDVKSTQLVFTLTDGIKEIELPSGKTTAIIHGKKPDGTETIVVLGSKVNSYGPSLMTANRLKAAIKFMNEHPDTKCVLSGGQGPDEPFSEAKGMFDYMVSHGIDENRLYLEDRSTNTRENLKFSKELIEKEGLNGNIAIVSNEFHLYRAGLIAKKQAALT